MADAVDTGARLNTDPDFIDRWVPRMAEVMRGRGDPDNATLLTVLKKRHDALAAERDENKKAANAFKAMWEDAERERDELEGDIRSLEHELAAANERAEKAEEELKSLRAQPYTFTADSARMK